MDQPNRHDWTVECPCGCNFSAAGAKHWRGAGGSCFNRDVEPSAITTRIEVQCPQCLLWLDALDRIEDLLTE